VKGDFAMGYNNITGDSISTRFGNKEAQEKFESNFDAIFRKKKVAPDAILCDICGKNLSAVKECAWTSCPLNFNESRIDVIGQNGNDGDHYEK